MSSWPPNTSEDLINFDSGSPDFPPGSLTSTTLLLDSDFEDSLTSSLSSSISSSLPFTLPSTLHSTLPSNLIDSELLHLEEALQSASSTPLNARSRCDSRDSVELEQVLISIDDDLSGNACSTRKNSLDVRVALDELDRIINESTNSTNFPFNEDKDDIDGLVNPESCVTSVEDCLRELDNYLQNFDTSGSDVTDLETSLSEPNSNISDPNKIGSCQLATNQSGSNLEGLNKNISPNIIGPNKKDIPAVEANINDQNPDKSSPEKTNINQIDSNQFIPKLSGPNQYGSNEIGPSQSIKFGINQFDTNQFNTNQFGSNLIGPNETTNEIGPSQSNKFGTNQFGSNQISPNETNPNIIDITKTDPYIVIPNITNTNISKNNLPIKKRELGFSEKLRSLAHRSKSLRNGRQNPSFDYSKIRQNNRPSSAESIQRNHLFRNTIEPRHPLTNKRPRSANLDDSCSSGRSKRTVSTDLDGSVNDLDNSRSTLSQYKKDLQEYTTNLDQYRFEQQLQNSKLDPKQIIASNLDETASILNGTTTKLDINRSDKQFSSERNQEFYLNTIDDARKRPKSADSTSSLKRSKFRQSLDTALRKNKIRPNSADYSLRRNNFRATIGRINITKNFRSSPDCQKELIVPIEQGVNYDTDDEEIDWSWVHDISYPEDQISNDSFDQAYDETNTETARNISDQTRGIGYQIGNRNEDQNGEQYGGQSGDQINDQTGNSEGQTSFQIGNQIGVQIEDHRGEQIGIQNVQNIEPTPRNPTENIERQQTLNLTAEQPVASTTQHLSRTLSSISPTLDDNLIKDDVTVTVTHDVPVSLTTSVTDMTSSWLRSSMRRLRHFRLPSNHPHPHSLSSTPTLSAGTPVIQPVVPNRETARPVSAPVQTTRARSESETSGNRSLSEDSETSLDSVVSEERVGEDTAGGASGVGGPAGQTPSGTRRPCDNPAPPMPETRSPLGQWPHGLSSMLACLGCTLGLFNLSRFAILTVRFGANFIIQFLILSVVFGIPLFTLQLCLGQQLGAGVIDMWRISPLFQGVGIAILASQALIGLYSIVGVSWMFIYFRDSFITKQDQYKWAEPYEAYREDSRSGINGTYKISETVPDYFNGVVLQRHSLVTGNSFGAIKFQVAFNLAVVWMIVFVSLSKGLRSYAKVVYVFSLLPIFGTFVLCAKLLGMSPTDSLHEVFPATSWGEFFVNTKSWIAASQEAFLTWGLLGAAIMQLSSHNKHKHLLQRDSSLVIILTLTILMLTAFLANTCIDILQANGYSYVPNSFEKISTYVFLRSNKDPLPPSLSSTPIRYMTHSSFIIGEKVVRPGMDKTMESGYQVLRFATELVPATLAILGPTQISPFWAVLFYFVLILFGIAQQLAIWHCVITGIMAIKAKVLKSWETTITFFTCTFGFILGLPMTTEFGINVVYFLDYCVGGAWWLILVYLLQIVAVFMIRGRPYSGDTVVTALFSPNSGSCTQSWLAPLLSFIWNVILPVAMMVVCITQFKSGNFRELFIWHHAPSLEYWPTWTRQLGSMLQLLPILCIPIVAIVQSYRYLNNGPPDILDRIQLLYRPPLDSEHLDNTIHQTATTATTTTATIPAEDPPPKYTPPPSYTTATGARIAKMLRQSIRRSVRRIANVLGEGSHMRQSERPSLQVPPPDYSAVLVEMNQSQTPLPQVSIDVTDTQNGVGATQSERISRDLTNLQQQGSPLTAADVASILRSSFRRSTIRTAHRMRRSAPEEIPSGSLSAECLVDGIAPIGETSLVLETMRTEETKTTDDNRSSVI